MLFSALHHSYSKSILVLLILCLSSFAFADGKGKGKGIPFQNIQGQIQDLQTQIDNIQLTPGTQGPAGPVGPQGPEGPAGATGPQGSEGLQGSIGPKGDQGLAGADGAQGPQGPVGPTGPQGPEGSVGATGPQGSEGSQGPIGPQGDKGDQGDQGLAGADGAQGPQGPQGDTGAPGVNGLGCWDINSNRIQDSNEDINGDGIFNALDCGGNVDLSQLIERLNYLEARFYNSDLDNDGFTPANGDCNDTVFDINPAAAEITGNGVDDDCDGVIDGLSVVDRDDDGYTQATGDCNDNQASINPAAAEVCSDNVDNNCDGQVDETGCVSNALCNDQDIAILDSCGFGDINCINQTSPQCANALLQLGFCGINSGCDPAAPDAEICYYDYCTAEWEAALGANYTPVQCTAGEARPCGSSDIGACQFGTQVCDNSGRWSACIDAIDSIEEVCVDGIDNDCDGAVDNCENTDTNCGGVDCLSTGGVCYNDMCVECVTDGDCGTGDICNSYNACEPEGVGGTGNIGAGCSQTADCITGLNCVDTPIGSYCALACTENTECEQFGMTCASTPTGESYCVALP